MLPHRRQPTRLPCPWDSPGKNTGVGCHFLLRCTKVKSESEVAQSCAILSDPMDCSPPGSSVHGIFQARVLEWGAIGFSESESYWWVNQCSDYLTFPLLLGKKIVWDAHFYKSKIKYSSACLYHLEDVSSTRAEAKNLILNAKCHFYQCLPGPLMLVHLRSFLTLIWISLQRQ